MAKENAQMFLWCLLPVGSLPQVREQQCYQREGWTGYNQIWKTQWEKGSERSKEGEWEKGRPAGLSVWQDRTEAIGGEAGIRPGGQLLPIHINDRYNIHSSESSFLEKVLIKLNRVVGRVGAHIVIFKF